MTSCRIYSQSILFFLSSSSFSLSFPFVSALPLSPYNNTSPCLMQPLTRPLIRDLLLAKFDQLGDAAGLCYYQCHGAFFRSTTVPNWTYIFPVIPITPSHFLHSSHLHSSHPHTPSTPHTSTHHTLTLPPLLTPPLITLSHSHHSSQLTLPPLLTPSLPH